MASFHVYVLRSLTDATRHYTGFTSVALPERLACHNAGRVPHTAKFAPWQVEVAVKFRDEAKARAFETYLKSGSGREFARRHF